VAISGIALSDPHDQLLLPAISLWEVATLIEKKRLAVS
jgi:PIN domain nuclease of toxin-antitoxin system